MDNDITAYVGLDVHKDSIAIAVAAPGRAAPRFVGTTGPELAELVKALSHLGRPGQLLLAYEAAQARRAGQDQPARCAHPRPLPARWRTDPGQHPRRP